MASATATVSLLVLLLGAWWGFFLGPQGGDAEVDFSLRIWRHDQELRLADAVPLREGDLILVRGELPARLVAALFWFDSDRKLHELEVKEQVLGGERKELTYPKTPGKTVALAGSPGTEIIFLCAKESKAPKAQEIASLFPEDKPLLELPEDAVLVMDGGGVKLSGARGPGALKEQPQGLLQEAEALQRELLTRFQAVSGVAFPHR